MLSKFPLRQAVAVLLPLSLLAAGLVAIDLFDHTLQLTQIGRVEAGIAVFAIAAVLGWALTRGMTPRGRR